MRIVEVLKVIFLGIVEGITEWLPISSTGHMILVNEFLKLNVSEEFWNMFLVVIQLGAILAVIVLYFNKLNPFSKNKDNVEKKNTWLLWSKVLIAVIPAGVIGILLDEKISALDSNYLIVSLMLIVYGILFIIVENKRKNIKINQFNQLSYKSAFIIGIFQVLALIPGTSRSGATILGASMIGTSRYIAAEFSFFLAIPVMFGASFVRLVKFGFDFSSLELVLLLIGMLVAFVISILAIKFLINYIKKKDFKLFGWYRIVLGLLVILYFLVIRR